MTIDVYMPAFYLGVQEELEKAAFDVSSMPLNENILPTFDSQAKWKYVRTKNGLKLSDGNLVYSFGGIPENYPSEDLRVSRLDSDNILDFEKDALGKGTAQIHRSSPDNIYMTLADGRENPTFMLQHEEGKNWRYSPSKKFVAKLKALEERLKPEMGNLSEEAASENPVTRIDTASLMEGANDHLKQAFEMDADTASEGLKSFLHGAQNFGENFIASRAAKPITSIAEGYFANKALSGVLDKFNPERITERKMMTPSDRGFNELKMALPGAAVTLASMAAKTP